MIIHSNDNRLPLILTVVAMFWWQSATTPAGAGNKQVAALPIKAPNVAPPETPTQQTAPLPEAPILPGQVGSTYEEAMKLAKTAMLRRVFQVAADNYRACTEYKPVAYEPHYGLAMALEALNLPEEALAEYFGALTLKPDAVDVREQLGTFFLKRQSWDEAAGQFLQVLKLRPEDLTARGNLGLCYLAKGQTDTAIEQFKYIIQNQPKNIEAHYNLAVAYQYKPDRDAALAEYKQVLLINPKHPLACVNYGLCLLDKGELKTSEQYLRAAIKNDPQNYLAYIGIGRICEVQKREKEALDWFKKAINVNPKAPECQKLMNNMMRKRAKELGLNNLPGLN